TCCVRAASSSIVVLRPAGSSVFPYTTLFRSADDGRQVHREVGTTRGGDRAGLGGDLAVEGDGAVGGTGRQRSDARRGEHGGQGNGLAHLESPVWICFGWSWVSRQSMDGAPEDERCG